MAKNTPIPPNTCVCCNKPCSIYDDFCLSCTEDGSAEGFREGQRAALEGMDLPDGAYFAMADDMGLDPLGGER